MLLQFSNEMPIIYIYIMLMIASHELVTSHLVKVAVKVANNGFVLRKETTVSWRGDTDVVNGFLKKFNGPVVTVDFYKHEINRQCEQYVFFAATTEEYDYFLNIMKQDQILPVRVILVLIQERISNENLRNILKTSWSMDISDLAIIHKGDEEDVKITTYFPKTEENCENYDPVTINASKMTDFFPRKFKNFYNCPLRVSLLDWPPYVITKRSNGTLVSISGTEGRLVEILMQKLNATLVPVFSEDFGHLTPYGGWTGTMGDLIYGRADISATSAITNADRYRAVQLTHSYKILTISWCAPIRVETRAWAKVLRPLLRNSTFLFGAACVLLIIICACVQKFQLPSEASKPTLFYSYAIFLGQCVQFETASWLLNSIFILWVWACLILRIAFQGELIKDLEMVIMEPPFTSFAEAHTQIENYGGLDTLMIFYEDSAVAESYQPLSLAEVLVKINSISRGERFILAIDLWTLRHLGVRVQILGEPAVRSPVSILVRPRWAASREFDSVLLGIFESGIYDKILEDYVSQHMLKNHNKLMTRDLHFTPLDWLHLSGCFYMFLIWCAFCCFLLGLENIWFQWTQRTNK